MNHRPAIHRVRFGRDVTPLSEIAERIANVCLVAACFPKRHAATFFDMFEPERRAINQLLGELRPEITTTDASVIGLHIGVNNGEVAGQTIDHAHVHLIPWRVEDVPNPRGGVRAVIPGKAVY